MQGYCQHLGLWACGSARSVKMADPVCVDDFEKHAKKHLPKYAFEYFAGGADEENTLRENVEAFKR